jgi:pimeloyl-ACP methyl ester carboxylesterase
MDALVDDLVTVVESLDVVPVMVGASMGGLTAMLALGERQVRAGGLVLVDVAPRVESVGVQRIHAFMTAASQGFATLEDAAEAVAAYNPHRPRPTNLEGLRRNLRVRDDGRLRWHWDPAFMDIANEPSRAERHRRFLRAAHNVIVPTLLVRGTDSDVVSEAGAAELLRAIPGSVEVAVRAGHMVVGDDNDVFGTQLLAFLGRVQAPDADQHGPDAASQAWSAS